MAKKEKIEHPAYSEDESEETTPGTVDKTVAGVSNEVGALRRALRHALDTNDGKLIQEVHKEINEQVDQKWNELEKIAKTGRGGGSKMMGDVEGVERLVKDLRQLKEAWER